MRIESSQLSCPFNTKAQLFDKRPSFIEAITEKEDKKPEQLKPDNMPASANDLTGMVSMPGEIPQQDYSDELSTIVDGTLDYSALRFDAIRFEAMQQSKLERKQQNLETYIA